MDRCDPGQRQASTGVAVDLPRFSAGNDETRLRTPRASSPGASGPLPSTQARRNLRRPVPTRPGSSCHGQNKFGCARQSILPIFDLRPRGHSPARTPIQMPCSDGLRCGLDNFASAEMPDSLRPKRRPAVADSATIAFHRHHSSLAVLLRVSVATPSRRFARTKRGWVV